ncbi:MAG: phasin family protein [Pseudomonadota bacterium]
MTDKFPFAFDFGAMTEAFKTPAFDFTALQETQQKNFEALINANKTAMSGYQEIYKRQQTQFETAMADVKNRISDLQGQPVTVETATQNFEDMKSAFEGAMADLKEVAELAQNANMQAFEILKARGEEVLSELKAATEAVH